MMNRKILFWPLAAMLLTACEKALVDEKQIQPEEWLGAGSGASSASIGATNRGLLLINRHTRAHIYYTA